MAIQIERHQWRSSAVYIGLLAGAFALAIGLDFKFGRGLDNAAYDEIFRQYTPRPWQRQSVLLVIDERTLGSIQGGMRGIRGPLAEGLRLVAAAKPAAVALDVVLADHGDPVVDEELASALRATPNLVLSSELLRDGSGWEDPRPEFKNAAKALGHVHAFPDPGGVTRSIPLERIAGHSRRWALSLEAFRLSRNAEIDESTDSTELVVGNTVIPASGDAQAPLDQTRGGRTPQGVFSRLLRVRFSPSEDPPPRVALHSLLENHALASRFAGKAVFVGVTAQTEHDRLLTPTSYWQQTSGIEINADAFETMVQRAFITDVPNVWVLLVAAGLVASAGLAFRYLPGWRAYAVGAAIVAFSGALPYVFFTQRLVLPFAASFASSVLGVSTAAAYYHLVVRKSLRRSEAEKQRYQQAMHFVTHEMRTPLSAIQGSSELISRFALTEEKRKQIALLINSESKRLARMVEIFLNVERLSAGQMELKREAISVKLMMEICMVRVQPLAERKHIGITLTPISDTLELTGDRELMEYACYNLMTNAVKYSPQKTEVTVSAKLDGNHVRIAVQDQGIGMDQKEVKQIFRKFYRTRKAEESGEAGTGIGLSIVQQIVEQHGGVIDVVSQPGAGSCFTLVLPAAAPHPANPSVPAAAERN